MTHGVLSEGGKENSISYSRKLVKKDYLLIADTDGRL